MKDNTTYKRPSMRYTPFQNETGIERGNQGKKRFGARYSQKTDSEQMKIKDVEYNPVTEDCTINNESTNTEQSSLNETQTDTCNNKSFSGVSFTLENIKKMTEKEISNLLGIGVNGWGRNNEATLYVVSLLLEKGAKVFSGGLLDIHPVDGFGYLRNYLKSNFSRGVDDIYISQNQIKRCYLRNGDEVFGSIRPPQKGEKFYSMLNIETVNGTKVSNIERRVDFDSLVAIYPHEKFDIGDVTGTVNYVGGKDFSSRIVDIISPIGLGQRALVVAQPKTGKTVLMQQLEKAISLKRKDVHIMVVLVGERPEEVTEMQRAVKGEVYSSTFDEPSQNHVMLAEMALNRAKRLVEKGVNVVIMLDSITRLGRAYNDITPSSGRVLTGGVDSGALYKPKRFFGAARNIEDGGSLTIIATALVETGSKMDDVIFEEFKGTGNSEIYLSRKIADKRVFPAIDISKSGTRREELLLTKEVLKKVWVLRRIVSDMNPEDAIEFLKEKMGVTDSNDEFFNSMGGVVSRT